jgi:hypothetical protein
MHFFPKNCPLYNWQWIYFLLSQCKDSPQKHNCYPQATTYVIIPFPPSKNPMSYVMKILAKFCQSSPSALN